MVMIFMMIIVSTRCICLCVCFIVITCVLWRRKYRKIVAKHNVIIKANVKKDYEQNEINKKNAVEVINQEDPKKCMQHYIEESISNDEISIDNHQHITTGFEGRVDNDRCEGNAIDATAITTIGEEHHEGDV